MNILRPSISALFLLSINLTLNAHAEDRRQTGTKIDNSSQIVINGSTHLELFVTDPSGKKVGKLRNKDRIPEAGDSTYGYNNSEGDMGPKPEYYSNTNLAPGKYRIDFFNPNGGDYKLIIDIYDADKGGSPKQKIVKGQLSPKEDDYFEIIISKDKEAIYKLPRSATTK